jgi:dipeptidase
MDYEYDGKTYLNERAIATQQTGFWFIGQARSFLPDVIGGLLWFGTDDAATSYLTPIYTNINRVPDCLKEGNGDLITYSATSSFWMNNRIANACYKMYNQMAPFVRAEVDKFEKAQMDSVVKSTDLEALSLYNKAVVKIQKKMAKANEGKSVMVSGDPYAGVRRYLTKFSDNTAQNQFAVWTKLEQTLLVKFIDGNVKAQNPDGTFRHSDYSTKVPDGLKQPGYTDKWKEMVVQDNGEVLEVKKKSE